jgi:DeoR family transcriptional regulator of aga operon/DeoR family fructose operon transcriptional repressor
MNPGDESASAAFADERQMEIARIVEEQGRARVNELAARFGVSAVTIRKDLDTLAEADRVIRTHGGAIASRVRRSDLSFDARDRLQREEKAAIGAAAASHVDNGESIVLDASTTGLHLARELLRRESWHGLTVVTNGIRAATELAGRDGITVLLMGGRVHSGSLSVVGQLGDAVFDRINVNKAFVSATGFSIDEGLTEAREEVAQIKRAMVGAAHEIYAMIDHSKWGRVASATFCEAAAVRHVFTDRAAPEPMMETLRGMAIEVTRHG